MTPNIRIYRNQFEDGVAIENEEGRIEAVVVHLPGSASTFYLAHMTPEQQAAGEFTELFSCPVEVA